MIDSLSQSSSWLTVEPDTYRYFFSASAQVFAAIFAVVAIAYSLKIISIHRQIDNLRREKIGKAILYKEHWGYEYLKNKLRGFLEVSAYNELQKRISELDEWTINIIIEAIQDRCHTLKEEFQKSTSQNAESVAFRENKIKYFQEIIDSIGRTKAEDTKLEKRESIASNNVLISTVLAGAMVASSLFMLWSEWYGNYFVFITLPIFLYVVYRITFFFVQTYSDSKPSIQLIFKILWDEIALIGNEIRSIVKKLMK